jgi:hypothetical protein
MKCNKIKENRGFEVGTQSAYYKVGRTYFEIFDVLT